MSNTTGPKREPIHTTDRDGAAIVLVPLANSGLCAKLRAEDFADLAERGLGANWFYNSNGGEYRYVRCYNRAAGNVVGLSRIIARAGRRQQVTYQDGDRTNLRRENLHIEQGFSRRVDAAFLCDEAQTGQHTPVHTSQHSEPTAAPL